MKRAIHQAISISKEIVKNSKRDPEYRQAANQALLNAQYSLLQYRTNLTFEERMHFLQQQAENVKFCFIQDDSTGTAGHSSIIVGGSNLVADFTIPTAPSSIVESKMTVKISFATATNQANSFLIGLLEQKLLYLMSRNCFQELGDIFQFLRMLDEEDSIGTVYSKNYELILNAKLPFLHDLDASSFLSSICWNTVGVFDIQGISFTRIFYYANLESLYLCGLYPLERVSGSDLTGIECLSKWKSQFYFVDLCWEASGKISLLLNPAIRLDSSVIEKYSISDAHYDSSFCLKRGTVESFERALAFLETIKCCLICAELDAKNEGCRVENSLTIPIEESLLTLTVNSTQSIAVSLDGTLDEQASKAATLSRNLQLAKSFVQQAFIAMPI